MCTCALCLFVEIQFIFLFPVLNAHYIHNVSTIITFINIYFRNLILKLFQRRIYGQCQRLTKLTVSALLKIISISTYVNLLKSVSLLSSKLKSSIVSSSLRKLVNLHFIFSFTVLLNLLVQKHIS